MVQRVGVRTVGICCYRTKLVQRLKMCVVIDGGGGSDVIISPIYITALVERSVLA